MYDFLFKILLFIGPGVDESILFPKFNNLFFGDFKLTVGVDFISKNLIIDERVCRLQLWALSSKKQHNLIINMYASGAEGAILFYNIYQENNIEELQKWINEKRDLIKDKIDSRFSIVVFGNNPSQVFTQVTNSSEKLEGVDQYFLGSIEKTEDIDKTFESLAKLCIVRYS